MKIEELAKRRAKAVPNAALGKYYTIAIPQYRIKCTVTMLKPKKITIMQEYILKFIAAGVHSISDISNYLGMRKSSINDAVAIMSQENLLIVNVKDATVQLTPAGHAAIDELNMIVPESVDREFVMDGLTGELSVLFRRFTLSKKEIKEQFVTPVVPRIQTPGLLDLTFEKMNRAINRYKTDYPSKAEDFEGELQRVSDIESVSMVYEKAAVLVFVNQQNELVELQVFCGASLANRNNEYEDILTLMHNEGIRVIEEDKKTVADSDLNDEDAVSWRTMIPQDLIDEAADEERTGDTEKKEQEVKAIEDELDDLDERTSNINPEQLDEFDEELTQRRAALIRERDHLKEELQRQKATRILSTYDHRPILEEALQKAEKCVVIVSPWIKAAAMDLQIINLIRDAVNRGVKIIIGYGISNKADSDLDVIRKLENIANQRNSTLKLVEANNTHEKVLIMDDNFVVITSFNWMSFRGSSNWGFRRETGIYLESKDVIASMKMDISSRFNVDIE